MLRDLAYAFRQMRSSPGFALAAVLTLVLGIGANAAIYQVLDAVLFRSLPVRSPEQLVLVRAVKNGAPLTFSYPVYRDLAARQQVGSMFAASDFPLHAAVLHGRGEARTVNGVLVTANYFEILGVAAQAGRVFSEGGDGPYAVISDAFWSREFARRREAIGQTLEINKAVVTILGVAPAGFFGETQGNAPDLWMPMSVAPLAMAHDWLNAPSANWLTVFARLRPGVSAGHARAAIQSLYRELTHDAVTIEVEPASRGIAELQKRFQSPLAILMGAVGMLLLIACCNLANLLAGRAEARRREFGLRLALGAGRALLVRQLAAESLLLASFGAVGGLLLSFWGARLLVMLVSQGQAWGIALTPDWRVLGFTASVSLAAAFLFGLSPALLAARVDPHTAFKGTRSEGGRMPGRWLAAAQVAVSLVLLSGAAMLARSLDHMRHQDFGFRVEHTLMVDLPWELSPAMMARYAAFRGPAFDKLNALPGVRAAALAGFGPMAGDQHTGPVATPDRPSQPGDRARIVHVSPRYFEAMGIPLVAGRGITAEDRSGAPQVVVLSRATANTLFHGADPVGSLVSLSRRYDAKDTWRVVGVAADVRFANPREPFGFLVYTPLEQAPSPITTIALRTAGDPAAIAGPVRAVVRSLDPDMVISQARPLEQVIDSKLGNERMLAVLAACFGALALALTCFGVYGVVAYAVSRRTREIGIRMALGAGRVQVTAGISFEVVRVTAIGGLAGAVGAVVVTRMLRSWLFGFANSDYGFVPLFGALLLAVSVLAGLLPAARAARVDPMDALRQE